MESAEIFIGEWRVSPALNQISRPGRVVNMEPRLIDLLVFFSRHPDVVLSRDELIENIWTRNFVTSHVVTQSVSELRKSLKDNQADCPEYIITVPKRGYKLVAPVSGYNAVTSAGDAGPPVADIKMSYTPQNPPRPIENASSVNRHTTPVYRSRGTLFCFLLTLVVCIALAGMAYRSARTISSQVTPLPDIINPRYIDISLKSGHSCNQWGTQYAFVSGLSDVISRLFNTYTGWTLRDKSSQQAMLSGYAGKTLLIEFVNQRHYRAQQCFMSVRLIDHASQSVMLDQRYVITRDNALTIQNDLVNHLSRVLKQTWPMPLAALLRKYAPDNSRGLQQYYLARHLLLKGDVDSLDQASLLLTKIIQEQPDFRVAVAEKVLADILRNSEQPFSGRQLQQFNQEVAELNNDQDTDSRAIYYQIMTIRALTEGNVSEAGVMIKNSMKEEYSWLNLLLQGKVYELEGDNQRAADSYISSLNLRPGAQTLYWIENGVFQSPVGKISPYLNDASSLFR